MALQEEIHQSTIWLIKAFKELNLKLDYSVYSVRFIDNLIDAQFTEGKPNAKGIMSENTGPKLFAISAYLGEVVIRNTTGSHWVVNDEDPQGEINIKVVSSQGTEMYPALRLMKRIHTPGDEGLYEYIHAAVTQYMKSLDDIVKEKRPWWKFL